MQISVTGKQINVGDNLRGHVEEKLNGSVKRFFDNPIKAIVSFSKEGSNIKADVSVHPISGLVVQGSGVNPDAYGAFEAANERIYKQLNRYKKRLTDHHKVKTEQVNFSIIEPEGGEEAELPSEEAPIIVAEIQDEIPLCTVSAAVMRMDLADLPALMFRNIAHGGLNMVYRRNDNNIGWIDPKTSNG